MNTVSQRPIRGDRTLRLPISEADYERFMTDNEFAKAQLDELYARYPELFPADFDRGYTLCGYTEASRKQQLRCRRLRVRAATVWTVAPAFMMPYMTAPVAAVEKGLLLMRFHVPCWVLAYVFGRDAMYWYRLGQGGWGD